MFQWCRAVLIVVMFVATLSDASRSFATDRPAQPSLKNIGTVSTVIEFELDDEAKLAFSLSELQCQKSLNDLLALANITTGSSPQPVQVVWHVKIEKFKPQSATPQAIEATRMLYGYEARLMVRQDVLFMRPQPQLPPIITSSSNYFIGSANTWMELESGVGIPTLVQEHLNRVMATKMDLLAQDWKTANP